MIKPNRILVLSLWTMGLVATVSAQSADKIIAEHQKAIGGNAQIKRMDSVTYTGTVTNPATGQTGAFCWRFKYPDRMELEMDLSGFEISTAYNGRSAWRRDSRDGLRTLTGNEGSLFKSEAAYRNDHFLNYKRDKVRAVALGQSPINGNNAFVIELTTPQGIKRKVYFDAKTFLILRDEQQIGDFVETVSFADYRKVDGIPEPFSIEIKSGDVTLKATIHKAEHNQQIAEAKFDYPKLSNEALPEIPGLLRD